VEDFKQVVRRVTFSYLKKLNSSRIQKNSQYWVVEFFFLKIGVVEKFGLRNAALQCKVK